MRKQIFFILVLFVPFLGGCIRFYGHEKFVFNVFDAEDEMPIEGARVGAYYLGGPFYLKNKEVFTDNSGTAELKVADYHPRHLGVRAKGYTDVEIGYSGIDTNANMLKARDKNAYLVLMYKEPRPRIEVVVPDAYIGPVAVELTRLDKMVHGKPGQRLFTYKVNPRGYVEVELWHLFTHFGIGNITVRYDNGVVIPNGAGSPEYASFRGIARDGNRYLCFIGTEKDALDFKSKQYPGWESQDTGKVNKELVDSYFKKLRVSD